MYSIQPAQLVVVVAFILAVYIFDFLVIFVTVQYMVLIEVLKYCKNQIFVINHRTIAQ